MQKTDVQTREERRKELEEVNKMKSLKIDVILFFSVLIFILSWTSSTIGHFYIDAYQFIVSGTIKLFEFLVEMYHQTIIFFGNMIDKLKK